jgi:hypothetical protein
VGAGVASEQMPLLANPAVVVTAVSTILPTPGHKCESSERSRPSLQAVWKGKVQKAGF